MKESKKITPYSGTTVEVDKFGYALAFSKAMIPVIRNEEKVRKFLINLLSDVISDFIRILTTRSKIF